LPPAQLKRKLRRRAAQAVGGARYQYRRLSRISHGHFFPGRIAQSA
jgi:hypothetical protein